MAWPNTNVVSKQAYGYIRDVTMRSNPYSKTFARLLKIGLVFAIGLGLLRPGAFGRPAESESNDSRPKCCRSTCAAKSCSGASCCVKEGAPSAPATPAPIRLASQHDLLALPSFPFRYCDSNAPRPSDFSAISQTVRPVTAIPLFQWNCSYLI